MADGVSITSGAGTTILTDDTGAGGHAQVMKLAISTDGSGTLIPADATYGISVAPRPRRSRLSVASSGLTTSVTAYTIGDTAGTQYTFANAARVSGGTGTIEAIGMLDKGDVGVDYRVHIYRASVTLSSDNAAWAVSDGDQDSWITSVTMPSMADVGANRLTYALVGAPYDCAATSLFVGVETRTANAVYAAATDLVVMLYVLLD